MMPDATYYLILHAQEKSKLKFYSIDINIGGGRVDNHFSLIV